MNSNSGEGAVVEASSDVVTSIEQLEALYGEVSEPARRKETPVITPLQRRWIEASPFMLLASAGPQGLDCSPRGDQAPLVKIVDERTIHLPDRPGNNRVDSLRNIVVNPRVGLLFLIPGQGTTMRVNGTAVLRTDEALRREFAVRDRLPTLVIEITVEAVYTQCPKALIRSELWNSTRHVPSADLPTVGQIMAEITQGKFDGAAYDAAYPKRLQETLY